MKQSLDVIRLTALYFTGILAVMGMSTMCWCAIWKIYVDVPLLLVLQAITVGSSSVFATMLVGRTIAQLNQGSDIKTQPPIGQPKTEGQP